jgi:uncharacterized protein (DUF1697 family)
MAVHIALLRGINVGGHKPVAMSDLRDLLAELGFEHPRSLLQSGNLVFGSKTRSGAALEASLEQAVEKRFGLSTKILVRTAQEWQALIARNPFRDEAERDPSHLLVMVLKDAPKARALAALKTAISGPEVIRADGRQLYIVYPNGIGRSRLSHTLIEAKLGESGTGRNWNTVLKLAALAAA